jgi:membrane protease YdiL (CAAX protease family)
MARRERFERLERLDPKATHAGPSPAAPLVVYGAATAIVLGVAFVRGRSPLETEAWLPIPPLVGHVLSVVGGSALAVGTVSATRQLVRRWSMARALHAHLRPAIENAAGGTILALGLASAVGEELFFRGLLTPTFGLVLSSLAFGLLHQVRGEARWVWAGWATIMGLLFGALFLATGSLVGPIVAHAAINIANLRFLRDHDVEAPKPRRLGGLLGRT